jgi:hypothetical protein
MAAPNLRVEGQNFENFVEQPSGDTCSYFAHELNFFHADITEFDEALDRRVSALREQSFVSDQTVADRRRMVPSQVQDLLTDLLQRQREVEVPIVEPDDVAMEDAAEACMSESILRGRTQTPYFLLAFVAEYGRLEQQEGPTQDLAKELNEVRAPPTTNVLDLHSSAPLSPLTRIFRLYPG